MFGKSKHLFALFSSLALLTLGSVTAATPEAGWVGASAPNHARPGENMVVFARLTNTGTKTWEKAGPGRMMVSALIVDSNANPAPEGTTDASFSYPTPPKAAASVRLIIRAPRLPGRYTILVGLVRAGKERREAPAAEVKRLPLVVSP